LIIYDFTIIYLCTNKQIGHQDVSKRLNYKGQQKVLKPKLHVNTSYSSKVDKSLTYENGIMNINSLPVKYSSTKNITIKRNSERKKPKFKKLKNSDRLQCSLLNYTKDLEEEFGKKKNPTL
jgi:hypothetical protein